MKKFLRKNKKYLSLILIAVIAFNFLFLPLTALAQISTTVKDDSAKADTGGLISWFKGSAVLFISSVISSLFGAFFGMFLYLEAKIIDFILTPTNFSFTNALVVQTGWGITRDLANMFLILILLVIAFATVLKIQSYAIKQLWWKVLVVALLINFSLVIAGFVIDFTQVLTGFFLNQITGGGSFGTITTRLASSMQILNFYNPQKGGISGGLTQFSADTMAAVIGIILTLVGLVVTVFVFGATAVFLIVRILYLWFLLIVAPIAWMLWILPATSKYFSQWWDRFIQWAFFAPIYVFMIYLSLSIFNAQGKLNPKVFGVVSLSPPGWDQPSPGLTQVGMPSAIFQWILVIAMMFGSLIVAQKFGVEGANYARETLGGWGISTRNWAGRYARRKATGWAQPLTETEKAAAPPRGVLGRIGAAWRKTGAAVGGAAVAIPGVRLGYQKMLAGQQKTYQDSYGKYNNIDPAILKQTLESGIFLKPEDEMALQSLLIEKGKLKPRGPELIKILDRAKNYGQESTLLTSVIKEMDGDMLPEQGYDEAIRTDLIKRAKTHDLDKPFRKFFPALACKVLNKDLKDEMKKIDNLADIYEDQLEIPEVVKNMPTERLNEFLRKASKEKKQIFTNSVDKEFEDTSEALGVKKEIGRIAAITHRDTRNRQLSEFVDILDVLNFTPESRKALADLTRRKFAVDSQAWDTTI